MKKLAFWLSLLIFTCNSYSQEFIIGVNERDIYRFKNYDGAWQGKDIDLIEAVFRRIPHTFKIIAMPWPRILKSIESGRVDMTLAAAISPERQAYAFFSKHVFRYSHYMLFVHKDKLEKFQSINKLVDLANTNIVIGALQGAIYSDSYNVLLKNEEFIKRLAYIGNDLNMPAFVLKGRVDAYIDSEIEGKHYLLEQQSYNKNIVPLFRITTDAEAGSGLMFSKKSVSKAHVSQFNKALKDLHDSGEYQQISNKFDQATNVRQCI